MDNTIFVTSVPQASKNCHDTLTQAGKNLRPVSENCLLLQHTPMDLGKTVTVFQIEVLKVQHSGGVRGCSSAKLFGIIS